MPLLGQASGGWLESSSALRILHVGVRNSVGTLSADAFTQTNPPIRTTTTLISTNVDTTVLGCLSGSVAFSRPDSGSNDIGGPVTVAASGITALQAILTRPLGMFINTAAGNSFENQPAVASNKSPYVSGQGTYASQLFETQALVTAAAYTAADDLTYTTGMPLGASDNGYLYPMVDSAGADYTAGGFLENTNSVPAAAGGVTILGLLKMPSDSTQSEIVFDQRV
jgi:hypothetical protein